MKKQLLAALALSALSSLSHAYIVSYIFEGTVTHFPDASLPIDQSNDLMIGFLSFDTEDFLTPPDGECHICQFSYSITAGGSTWQSHAVFGNMNAGGSYLTSSGSLLTMQDEGPVSLSPLTPDLTYFHLNFSQNIQQGIPPSAEDFISGSWNLTHFLQVPAPVNAVMFGTIDKVTMRASVPEPSSLALVSLGFAGLLLRRRFSK